MAGFPRVNGLACTAGVMYPLNAKIMKITLKAANGTPVDIRTEDDAIDEVVEQLVKEVNPLAFYVPDDSSGGEINIVVDVSQSAAGLQHRIRQIGADSPATSTDGNKTFTYSATSVGPNDKDISGSVVNDAAAFISVLP
jgi:hypothetical protein